MNDFESTASMEMLKKRSDLTMSIHRFFQQRGFLHVDTPLLSHDTVVDRHIHPVAVAHSAVTGSSDQQTMWLQTSPEFCMKRLLASGLTHIYQITKAFRQSETGRRHNPEFTMLEWYRTGDDMAAGMQLLSNFVVDVLQRKPAKQISYREAFQTYAEVDPFSDSVEMLKKTCQRFAPDSQTHFEETSRSFWLNYLLSVVVEPRLGAEEPVIVFDWPADQAALARVRQTAAAPVAERFELYIDGVELANGYHELLDADELVRRNEAVNQQRMSDQSVALPTNSRLVAAMRHALPACAGVAVGVDRLLMVAENCARIDQVIAFPIDRA